MRLNREIIKVLRLSVITPVTSGLTEGFEWGPRWFRVTLSGNYFSRKGLFVVCLDGEGADEPSSFEYEFAARSKCTGKFVSKSSGSLRLAAACALNVIYETPLPDFEAGKSIDFIDGTLYLELKLRRIMQCDEDDDTFMRH